MSTNNQSDFSKNFYPAEEDFDIDYEISLEEIPLVVN